MEPVIVEDEVYGRQVLAEPLLVDVLQSQALDRLRGVHQAGASFLVREGRDGSRYEHVVGVGLLIRRLGGSIQEQAAGFIHDVSHTAFSHVSDQVFDRRDEGYHEDLMADLVAQSDLPGIAARHGVEIRELLNMERWTLLEQPLPDLCADRIDYTLRDLLRFGAISHDDCSSFVDALGVQDGRIMVTALEPAEWFVEQFYREVRFLFMDPLELYANNHLAQAIRLALERGVIRDEDLLLTDDALLDRLTASGDARVTAIVAELDYDLKVVEDTVNYDYRAFSKARTVDPLVQVAGGRCERLSTLSPLVSRLRSDIEERASGGVHVRAS